METFRHQRSPGSDRFLSILSSTPPDANGSSIGDELDEGDIFSTGPEPEPESENVHPKPRNPAAVVARPNNAHLTPSPLAGAGFRRAREQSFGILAALPEEGRNQHTFLNRKAIVAAAAASSSLSTSPSSSAARFIPAVPKPKTDFAMSVPSGNIYHQSAPVNVPVVPPRARKVGWGEVEIDEEKDGDEDGMLPPHEIVARANGSPMTTFSVLEGVGRTLKGRDLRRVRNAVWRKTGFLD